MKTIKKRYKKIRGKREILKNTKQNKTKQQTMGKPSSDSFAVTQENQAANLNVDKRGPERFRRELWGQGRQCSKNLVEKELQT